MLSTVLLHRRLPRRMRDQPRSHPDGGIAGESIRQTHKSCRPHAQHRRRRSVKRHLVVSSYKVSLRREVLQMLHIHLKFLF